MLTANVGFLAIPGVVISNLNGNLTSASQADIFTSHSQIASSLSMEASIGSIIIGLLLFRLNRTRHKQDPAGAVSGQSHLMLVCAGNTWAVDISPSEYSQSFRS
jgi:ABC-type cobalamin transport system permease subunit